MRARTKPGRAVGVAKAYRSMTCKGRSGIQRERVERGKGVQRVCWDRACLGMESAENRMRRRKCIGKEMERILVRGKTARLYHKTTHSCSGCATDCNNANDPCCESRRDVCVIIFLWTQSRPSLPTSAILGERKNKSTESNILR